MILKIKNTVLRSLSFLWKHFNNVVLILLFFIGIGMLLLPLNPFFGVLPQAAPKEIFRAQNLKFEIYALTGIMTIFFCLGQKYSWIKNALNIMWIIYFIWILNITDRMPSVQMTQEKAAISIITEGRHE